MENIVFIIIFVIVISVLLIKFFFSRKARIIRKLRSAGYKKISKTKDNEIVKIVGNIEIIDKPLISPLSQRLCTHYYVHIEQRVSSGRSSHWDTIIEKEVSSKFIIRDENSYAFINDTNIETYIVQDRSYKSGFMNDATDNLNNYLQENGYESDGLFGVNKTIRYKEGILEIGEEIAIFGKGKWKDFSTLNLEEKYGKVLEITSHDGVAIYMSDDPKTTLRNAKKESSSKRKNSHKRKYRR